MKNHLLRSCLCLLAGLCLFCGFATAEQAGDPIVITVGQVSYPLSMVQYAANGQVMLQRYQGAEITDDVRSEILDSIREQFIMLGLIENKLIEKGQNDFSDLETSTYMTYAQNTYEQLWQGFRERLRSEGISNYTDEEVTAWLNSQGYTLANLYQESLVQARWNRIIALYCPNVTVTEAEIADYYIQNYVEQDRARYADDIPTYEAEILANGYDAFYTPAGYRRIRQLLFPYPDSVLAETTGIKLRRDEAAAAQTAAYNALAQAAANGQEIAPFKAAYDDASAALTAIDAEYSAAMSKALPLLQPATDEVTARLAAGEQADALIAEYGLGDDMLLFHPASAMWVGELRDAAAALEHPGDISAPLLLANGVGLLYYVDDLPAGPHQLTAEEQSVLYQTVLTARQSEVLAQAAEQWRQEYPITVDLSLLVIP